MKLRFRYEYEDFGRARRVPVPRSGQTLLGLALACESLVVMAVSGGYLAFRLRHPGWGVGAFLSLLVLWFIVRLLWPSANLFGPRAKWDAHPFGRDDVEVELTPA